LTERIWIFWIIFNRKGDWYKSPTCSKIRVIGEGGCANSGGF